jgi:UDP-glucose 4-epimerase
MRVLLTGSSGWLGRFFSGGWRHLARTVRPQSHVVARYFPDAPALYARQGWRLPTRIGRVYDASRIERALSFRCCTDFSRVLEALRTSGSLPFIHDPRYVSPKERSLD